MSFNELPAGWKLERVSELASKSKYSCVGGPFGSSLTRKDYVEYEGVPVSRGSNLIIGSRLFLDDDFVYVSEDKAKKLEKNMAYPGDIVLTQRGTIGQVAIIPENARYEKYILSQNQMKITVDQSKVLPYYFLYYFLSNEVQNKIQRISIGGVIPGFNLTQFREFEVLVPPLEEQKHIVDILGSLDDIIELNRQINQTLEQIAQTIFKSWFVDFEPVKAKIEAKQNGQDPERAAMRAISGKTDEELGLLSPEQRQQLTTTAALFPNELEDSELGEIPRGWSVGVLGDICTQAIGGQWGKDEVEEGLVPAICLRGCDMEDVRDHGFALDAPVRYIKQNALEKRLMNHSDLLIAASGAGPCGRPLWCSPGLSIENYGSEVIYSNFVKRFTCKSPSHAIYIDSIIYEKYKNGSIGDYITGTSVPNLDATGLLSSFQIVIPSQGVLDSFADLYQKSESRKTSSENRLLADIRDSLLPKLLSGEIALGETQSTAEAVA